MKTIDTFNNEGVTPEEASQFRTRKAVRAVVLDENNNVAVIHAVKRSFYELPGGGVEDNEDYTEAIIRECKEEIGCDVEVVDEIGFIVEYRKQEQLIKESYCYLCRVIGNKGELDLQDDEKELQISIEWVGLDQAHELILSSKKPGSYIAEFSAQRDSLFIQESKNLIK